MTQPLALRSLAALRQATQQWRTAGKTYALVPTMGALHDGHLRLVREGLKHADHALATIFVNPKQFAANEDLGRYPRDEVGDLAKLASAGCTAVYLPTVDEIYPQGFATSMHMSGPALAGLEDKFRPHFFDGVATIVAKLFISSGADVAMFGEKDYQQLLVVRRMAADLNIPIDVIGVPTMRESSGLAMSSRNQYLSGDERRMAVEIHAALQSAAAKIRGGAKPAAATSRAARTLKTHGFNVDYVAARNAENLAKPKHAGEPLRLLAAAWLGKTRLIDNIPV